MIADHFEMTVSKQSKWQVLKCELVAALSEKGVLEIDPGDPATGTPAAQPDSSDLLLLKELGPHL